MKTAFAAGSRSPVLSRARSRPRSAGVGDGYHGRRTASGARFNTFARAPFTVAHKTLPFGRGVTITNLANGRAIYAVVTDRGPFVRGRCVDLGRAGADALGMGGTARVSVQ
ncbi:rare lipoprotein A [Bradyrhizobium japonicum]|uniref:Rare lipoprotein A n=1 Tax=Bradyrhizobium japonicum TaxID=375 RepID=A0ABV2RR33_BRAJP|nr:septal ring lytic transglycosylase RlpA family protein [Bradyrhizobium japonicum]UQD97245.1 septal ring lytic transglycosylase RlpA family protein [Bradyrhizobium japonicum]WLB17363.1 septal ring lytic transglycosylase RlpA family protein [Bradyrhizobium japonicum]